MNWERNNLIENKNQTIRIKRFANPSKNNNCLTIYNIRNIMKKFLILLFLMATGTSVYAQKSYITIYAGNVDSDSYQYMYLTGDLPSDIKSYYSDSGVKIGTILNLLSQKGFEVESFCAAGNGTTSPPRMFYLLSKKSSSNDDSAISIVHSDDGEAYEVARYNLQGMQVNENTKGIQIIVYSNYTTKTVIVE